MAKTLTIELSDAQYDALRAAAEAAHTSPERLAADTVAGHFDANNHAPESARPTLDPLIQFMRERGHLRDPHEFGPPPQFPGMPPYGTPEWEVWVHEADDEEPDLRDVNFADWVER
ncbi:MAG TPA: hypothetical protein VF120_18250 [Ktedonobacterales bacterium]